MRMSVSVHSLHRVLVTSCTSVSVATFCKYIFQKFHIHTFRIILHLTCKHKLLYDILICRIFITVLRRKNFCYYFCGKNITVIIHYIQTFIHHIFLEFSRRRKILRGTPYIIHYTLVILKVN